MGAKFGKKFNLAKKSAKIVTIHNAPKMSKYKFLEVLEVKYFDIYILNYNLHVQQGKIWIIYILKKIFFVEHKSLKSILAKNRRSKLNLKYLKTPTLYFLKSTNISMGAFLGPPLQYLNFKDIIYLFLCEKCINWTLEVSITPFSVKG